MLGSSVLEVAIGVIFVYLLLSLLCSAINEWIASKLNQRGSNLFEGIKNLLNDPKFTGLAQQLYNHGLVDGISKEAANVDKPNRLPSYIPSNTFALALLDILGSHGVAASVPAYQQQVTQRQEALNEANQKLAATPGDASLQKAVADAEAALKQAQQDLDQAKKAADQQKVAQEKANAVTGFKDLTNIKAASDALEEALDAGRALAAAYPDPLANIQKAIEALPSGHTRETLLVLLNKTKREEAAITDRFVTAEHAVEQFQKNIEQWFNDAMERVGGWYKRWTQKILLGLAFATVFIANADTVMLVQRLTRDSALRASLITAAEDAVKQPAPAASAGTGASSRANTGATATPGTSSAPGSPSGTPESSSAAQGQRINQLLTEAKNLNLPIGWSLDPNDPRHVPWVMPGMEEKLSCAISKLLGLLITVFAVSLGAPFWFDTLSKFINLRGAGTPPGEPKKSAPRPPRT